MTRHVTIELTEAQAAVLDLEAAREDRSVETVVSELIQRKVDYDARFRRAVEQGLEDVARGAIFSHEEVVARAKLRTDKLLARLGDG